MTSNISPGDAVAKSHNFIVIGGGTAGLVVATRLTENPDIDVLVLEAGENRLDDPKTAIPMLMGQLYEDPKHDWCFKTTPQKALNDRIIAQPRGRLLGGSSSINFMIAAHPSSQDIDNWEKLGNPTWNWETLLPYYRKSETFNIPSDELKASLGDIFDPELYGKDGPVQLTFPHSTGPPDAAWRSTLQTLGVGAMDDPRRGETLGGYAVLRTIDLGAKRSHAGTAYYLPASSRKNLTVVTGAHVNKILLETDTGKVKATGVCFTVAGKEYTVSSSNEVILAAGTFQSPQVLELSGVGSAKVLAAAGVELVVENENVGENLQDHTLIPLMYEAAEGVLTAEALRQPGVLDWALNEWKSGRGGPLAAGVSGTSFLTLRSIIDDAARVDELIKLCHGTSIRDTRQLSILRESLLNDREPDVQLNFACTGMDPYVGDRVSGLLGHTDPGSYIGSAAVINHPFSRGSCHISSSDPLAHPTLDPNYFSEEVDMELTVDALLFIQKIYHTCPLAEFIKTSEDGQTKQIQHAFKLSGSLDRAMARKFAKDAAISSWHPIGTCAMLPRHAGGVVDPRLKVYGIEGLRIVDASVMPRHVRGNISTSVYAIAERAADMIKEDLTDGVV